MDILSTILIALFSIPLLVLWSYRGGSLGWNWMPRLPRIGNMASTPLFICLCLLIALGIPTLFQALMMVLGFAAFVWAQVPGWGRQMDLGKNDKPDDEWGHTIRDWFFVEQSSYRARSCRTLYENGMVFYSSILLVFRSSTSCNHSSQCSTIGTTNLGPRR
jgi:hypothetical protein